MDLFHSPTSPYVRKVDVAAIELGLDQRLNRIRSAPHPTRREEPLSARNPLGKVPTLVTDDKEVLYPSSLICEYLDEIDGSSRLFPAAGMARRQAMRDHALGDGILDAALLVRYEMARPPSVQWAEWVDGQTAKITASLRELESRAEQLGDRVDIGAVCIACALGYLDFRFDYLCWRESSPRLAAWFEVFSERESMRRTKPR